jgi:hypothetical protein
MPDRYLAVGEETTYGTAASPTRYIDILREALVFDKGITPVETVFSRDIRKYVEGRARVTGSVDFNVEPENIGEFLKWALGSVTTTDDGAVPPVAYKHEFKPADIIKSFTGIVISEKVQRKITGCLIDRLTIETALDIAMGSIDVVAAKEEKDTGSYTPTISTLAPFVFKQGTLTLGGSDRSQYLRALRLRIGNNIPVDDLYGFGSQYLRRIGVRARTVECDIEMAFEDTTEYDAFLAGTEVACNLVFTGPSTGSTGAGFENYKLEIDLPKLVYRSDVAPHIDRREPLRITAPMQVLYDSAKGYECAITLVNKISSY